MNTYSYDYTTKISSTLILAILALSTFGVLAFAPVQLATAATGPTITLSTTHGTGGVTVGVEVMGTGFPELQAGSHVAICYRDSTLSLPLTCQFQQVLYGQSIFSAATGGPENTAAWGGGHGGAPAGLVDPDANGAFTAFFDPGALACVQTPCTYNVFAQYTPNNGAQTYTPTVTWTNTPYIAVKLAQDNGASPWLHAYVFPTTHSGHFGSVVQVYVRGFGATESVNIIGLPTSATVSLSTDSTGKTNRIAASAFIVLNKDTQGGAKSITAIGISTGASQTTTFTIKPSIEVFSDSACTAPITSLSSTAPRTFYLNGHGFVSGETIAANSITLGGTATSSNSLTGATDGSFSTNGGGSGGNKDQCTAVISTGSLSFGPTTIGITGSTSGALSFNAANANIVDSGVNLVTPAPSSSAVDFRNFPLLVSANQASGTAIVSFSANNVWATNEALYSFWGTFAPGTTVFVYASGYTAAKTMAATQWDGAALSTYNPGVGVSWFGAATDGNGANFGVLVVPESAMGGHTVLVTATGSGATSPGASVTVVPALWFNAFDTEDDSAGVVAFTGQNCLPFSANFVGNNGLANCGTTTPNYGYLDVYGSGFKNAENVGISMGTTQITASLPSAVGASGSFFYQFPLQSTGFGGVPDLPGGTYDIKAAGSTSGNSATGVDTLLAYLENTNAPGVTVIVNPNLASNLSPPGAGGTVSVGDTMGLLSSIAAATGIHGLAPSSAYEVHLDGPSGPLLATFTSNANGQVPPGVNFQIPQTTSGNHFIDLVQSGASAITGMTMNAFDEPAPFGVNPDESVFGSLYLHVAGALTLTPTAGGVGTTVTVGASGLATSQGYAVQVNGLSYATFTTDASGAIPSGTTFKFPSIPVTTGVPPANSVLAELGTAFRVQAINTVTAAEDAHGTFLLQSQLTLSSASGAAGSSVSYTANGLEAGQFYNIIWNAQINANGLTSGQAIASFVASANGAASGTINVPAGGQPGAYVIQLLHSSEVAGAAGTIFRLVNPPTFTIGAPSGVGTTTLTPGTPAQTTLAGQPAASISYTNTLTSPITVVSYGIVKNSLGQIVYYTTATMTLSAGGTQTAFLILAGLPSGSYQVSIFAVSTNGVVVSTTSTITVTV